MLDRLRLGCKSVKEKGATTVAIAAVVVVIVVVAGVGVYFLMKHSKTTTRSFRPSPPVSS